MNKDVLLVVCVLIALVSIVFGVFSFEKQHKLSKSLEEEKYSRLVAEESSQKSAAKLASYENQVKAADEKMAKIKDVLDQEKSVNSDLQKQYDKLAQTKADLEAKLQAAIEEKAQAAKQAEAAVVVPVAATDTVVPAEAIAGAK